MHVECSTTLISVREGPVIEIIGPLLGNRTLRPRALVLATGIRESNRGNRMIPGARPEYGILTTGQLQQLVARRVQLPGHIKTLAVVGTEHVAFSTLWTARHGGYSVRTLIGEEARIRSFAPARWMARLLGADIILGARVKEIIASNDRVTALRCEKPEGLVDLPCDGIVFTAEWIPEIAALHGSAIAIDPRARGPVIDQAMRTNLAGIFAAGNMLRSVESSGWAANEGRRAGHLAARFIHGQLPSLQGTTRLVAGDGIDYVVPQRWDTSFTEREETPGLRPSARVNRETGPAQLHLSQDGVTLWAGPARSYRPHRRIRLDIEKIIDGAAPEYRLSVTKGPEIR